MFIDTFISITETSAEGDCRNIVFLSPVANALHNFAEAALPVCPTLACDDEIRAGQQGIKIDQVEDGLNAGLHFRVEEDLEGCAETAGSTCARCVVRVDAELFDDDVAIAAHALFQAVENLRRAAFLFAEGVGGSVFSAERICDIAHDGKMYLADAFRNAAHINVSHFFKLAALALEHIAVSVQEFDTEGACKSHSAVICSRTPDSDGNICMTRVHGCQDKLAGSIGRSVQRVAKFFGYHRKAGGLGHFEDGLIPVDNSVICLRFFHQRSVDCRVGFLAVGGQDDCVRCALSAVGDGNADRLAGTEYFVGGFCQKLYRFFAGYGSLEGIRCKYQFHENLLS